MRLMIWLLMISSCVFVRAIGGETPMAGPIPPHRPEGGERGPRPKNGTAEMPDKAKPQSEPQELVKPEEAVETEVAPEQSKSTKPEPAQEKKVTEDAKQETMQQEPVQEKEPGESQEKVKQEPTSQELTKAKEETATEALAEKESAIVQEPITKEEPTDKTPAGNEVAQSEGQEPKQEKDESLPPVPIAPVPVELPQAVPAETVPQEELIREIDTMELEQPEGNWLLKRHWWEKAKNKYKKIRELYEQIMQLRMNFFEKRSNVEKTIFDPFNREIGVEQTDLKETVDSLLDLIDEESDNQETLEQEDLDFLRQVTAVKGELEQLKIDIDSITNIDSAMDDALSMLVEKVNEAGKFERAAWDEFDAIAQELSDTRARERYYVIENIYDNLKVLQGYLQNDYATYFETIIQSAKDKTERFKEVVQMLKSKGIDLKEQASKLEEEEDVCDLEAAKKAAEEAARKAALEAAAAKVGFFGKILGGIVAGLKWLWNAIFGWWLYRI